MQSRDFKSMMFAAFLFVGGFFVVLFAVGALIAFFVAKQLDKDSDLARGAGFWRRIIARVLDIYIGAGIAVSITILTGLAVPLDQALLTWLSLLIIPLILLAIWYMFFGITVFPNTFGRYAMNVKVFDLESGGNPKFSQVFKRELCTGLWLVEIFVIVFNKTSRRIGDCWANTHTKVMTGMPPWYLRVLPAVLLLGLSYISVYHLSPLVNDNTLIGRSAKSYVREVLGEVPVGRPHRIEINNHEGLVTLKTREGRALAVYLNYSDKSWEAWGSDEIQDDALGQGFTFNQES